MSNLRAFSGLSAGRRGGSRRRKRPLNGASVSCTPVHGSGVTCFSHSVQYVMFAPQSGHVAIVAAGMGVTASRCSWAARSGKTYSTSVSFILSTHHVISSHETPCSGQTCRYIFFGTLFVFVVIKQSLLQRFRSRHWGDQAPRTLGERSVSPMDGHKLHRALRYALIPCILFLCANSHR